MPGKVAVKIKAGRNLPIMDRSSDTTDAYVEIKLGSVTQKTEVFRKSLNPQWNTDWFRFEVDDSELQDEPLQIRLMDHDTYSANDAIGKVNISLNPLCLDTTGQSSHSKGTVLSGWIPVFDTMHGIRGEVNVIVKVDLFSDINKFRQSSCGIPFFHSQCIPFGYRALIIHGFVEELVVNDDPEYQWIDKIRTPRASNEARQVVFLKLSGQVQRKMGIKAINMGANAVIGYTQCFDLEGDVGVVARGIGTAVTLIKDSNTQPTTSDVLVEESTSDISAVPPNSNIQPIATLVENDCSPMVRRHPSPAIANLVPATVASDPSKLQTEASPSRKPAAMVVNATNNSPKKDGEMCRRSSDSDLSVTPKGNSICVASDRLITATAMMRLSQPIIGKNTNADTFDMLEYPFLTITKYPAGFILHLGATVAARSVKLLERVSNPDEPEIRDSWWTELRMEIRSHARSLGCNVILGYSETTAISDDVCILSATGTAAVIDMSYNRSASQNDIFAVSKTTIGTAISTSLEERDIVKNIRMDTSVMSELIASSTGAGAVAGGGAGAAVMPPPPFAQSQKKSCAVCHIPYNMTSIPFNVNMKKCRICRKGRVPDVLLSTLEVPDQLHVTGRGCLIQAQVVRPKRDIRSELNAKEISDGLPFLEYELHRLLVNKLKAKGMNSIFGLRVQVAVGERAIALLATGTAFFLSALPVPQVPKIVAGNSWTDKQKLNELQKKLQETYEHNQEFYQLKTVDPDTMALSNMSNGGGFTGAGAAAAAAADGSGTSEKHSDTDESDDDVIEIDLNCGSKDACVLEVDDIEDLEIISLLMEPTPPEGFHVVNTQSMPVNVDKDVAKSLQMFTQVWRAKFDVTQNINSFPKHFQRILQTIYFKLRTMVPCAICHLRFHLDLPESDQIQLMVTGSAFRSVEAIPGNRTKRPSRPTVPQNTETIEEDAFLKSIQDSAITSNNRQKRMLTEDDYIFPLDVDDTMNSASATLSSNLNPSGNHQMKMRKSSPLTLNNQSLPLKYRRGIDLTPLSFIPGAPIEKYLGNLNFFFIRESTSIRENGGISGFVHSFIAELLAVVRAHIATLGGNAMVSFHMTELILVDNQHKNQGQCLISIGGDAVSVAYNADE